MNLKSGTFVVAMLSLVAITQLGCEKVPEELDGDSDFSSTDIAKTWTSSSTISLY